MNFSTMTKTKQALAKHGQRVAKHSTQEQRCKHFSHTTNSFTAKGKLLYWSINPIFEREKQEQNR